MAPGGSAKRHSIALIKLLMMEASPQTPLARCARDRDRDGECEEFDEMRKETEERNGSNERNERSKDRT